MLQGCGRLLQGGYRRDAKRGAGVVRLCARHCSLCELDGVEDLEEHGGTNRDHRTTEEAMARDVIRRGAGRSGHIARFGLVHRRCPGAA